MTLWELVMTLVFVGSVLVVLGMLFRLGVLALGGRWPRVRGAGRTLGWYVGGYLLVLVAVALALPRRTFAPGERECFDDWCVAGVRAAPAGADAAACAAEAGERVWLATLEVSSDAKRVRQRARDARALLEDGRGHRHAPCGAPLAAHALTDELGPGDAFRVIEPYILPVGAVPTGLVVQHGAFPGALIIGEDQSFPHPPTLLGVVVAGE